MSFGETMLSDSTPPDCLRRARSANFASFVRLCAAGLFATVAIPAFAGGRSLSEFDRVTQCVQSAPEDTIGLTELDAECPGLEAVLAKTGLAPFISQRQSDELTSAGVEDLVHLHDRYQRAASDAHSLEVGAVAGIVRQLTQAESPRPLTLKERFLRWLQQMFERRQSHADNWLSRWLKEVSVPDKARELITYTLIALVLVLAVTVLVNELRAAGVLKRSARIRLSGDSSIAGRPLAELTFADLDAATLQDKPSVMLQLLLAALVKSGRLQSERSLTPRELTARAVFDEQTQRENFRAIAFGAEHARYGNSALNAAQVDALIADGRALYAAVATARRGS